MYTYIYIHTFIFLKILVYNAIISKLKLEQNEKVDPKKQQHRIIESGSPWSLIIFTQIRGKLFVEIEIGEIFNIITKEN